MHPQLYCELTFKVCVSTALCLHASPTSHTCGCSGCDQATQAQANTNASPIPASAATTSAPLCTVSSLVAGCYGMPCTNQQQQQPCGGRCHSCVARQCCGTLAELYSTYTSLQHTVEEGLVPQQPVSLFVSPEAAQLIGELHTGNAAPTLWCAFCAAHPLTHTLARDLQQSPQQSLLPLLHLNRRLNPQPTQTPTNNHKHRQRVQSKRSDPSPEL